MSWTGTDFDSCGPDEQAVYGFDFIDILASGELIADYTFAIEVVEGMDPAISTRLAPSGELDSTIVTWLVGPLAAGVTYRLTATVTTLRPQTLELWAHLACAAPR